VIESDTGRLLIVDDEVESLTPMLDLVSAWGYEAKGFTSGRDALKALKGQDFDLLITDLVMPDMDGIGLLKAAKEIIPHIVCIVVTGYGTIQAAVEAMKIGAFDFITKPLDWKMLQPALWRAMNVSRLKRSEEKYRTIVEDQTELICRWRTDGVITFANEVCCRYFGKSHQEMTRSAFMYFVPAEDHEQLKKHIASLNKKNPAAWIEHRVIMPSGEIRWQRWTNRAIFDEQGHIVEFQSVGHDITERKLAEEQLRSSRDQLRALTKRLSEVEETERKRLARELHDQVGQNLTALGINLNMLRNQLPDGLKSVMDSRLNDSLNILEETAKRIRDVMADLRPSVLDDYGLMATIRWFSDQFSNRTGLSITVQGEELSPRLPPETEITLFRIAQEVLTNVAKHAQAGNVLITLKEISGTVHLTIIDDGVGFEPAMSQSMEKTGWGFLNIRERAEAIGGKLVVDSRPGGGTRVLIEIRR
jgi:two-component system sensor histidine kinase UhpB